MPFGLLADQNRDRGNHPGIYCIGRLKPGVSLESARADLEEIARQLAVEYPKANTGNSVSMQLLVDILTWLGLVAAGLAIAGGLLVALLAWLLNHPIDDDEPGQNRGQC